MISLKQKLSDGELVVGTFISEIRNPNIAHMLARAGFDYYIIDNEHGSYSPETISDMIAGARGAGMPVIVRIPEIRRDAVLKPLDAGAAGLLIPQVHTADQAQTVVRYAKYPPDGERGVGLRRPHSRYESVDAATYMAGANEDLLIAVQAESRQAVKNAHRIASVNGIDCVFVGPYDLSVDLGIPGQIDHEREIEAIGKVLSACRENHKISGILMFDHRLLQSWISEGVRFAAYSSDVTLLADAARNFIIELKNSVS